MKGRFPMTALWLDVPLERVDVNVHPTKNEVRFSDPQAVHAMVTEAVARTLSRPRSFDHAPTAPPRISREVPVDVRYRDKEMDQMGTDLPTGKSPGQYPEIPEQALLELFESPPNSETPLRVVGQLDDSYILCEGKKELVLIDQHAAHERILYERLKKKGFTESQYLLVPETIECSAREARLLESVISELASVGLEIEPFGPNSFVVKAVPAILPACDAGRLVQELIDRLMENEVAIPEMDRLDDCLKLMACHGAIRAGQKLSSHQMKTLVADIHSCTSGSRCPHGRPTWIAFSGKEIEKRFGRTG
jgi:DNA mismatch repair protein MutL